MSSYHGQGVVLLRLERLMVVCRFGIWQESITSTASFVTHFCVCYATVIAVFFFFSLFCSAFHHVVFVCLFHKIDKSLSN
jgi:hypothetical protein